MKLFLRNLELPYCLSEETLASDWIQILITFRSTCYHCGKEVPPGKAFWSNSAKAAKHLRCGNTEDDVIAADKPSNETVLPHNIIADPHTSHVPSSQVIDLKCYICGAKTGCNKCTFLTECVQILNPEGYCICKDCSDNSLGQSATYEQYMQNFIQATKKELIASAVD